MPLREKPTDEYDEDAELWEAFSTPSSELFLLPNDDLSINPADLRIQDTVNDASSPHEPELATRTPSKPPPVQLPPTPESPQRRRQRPAMSLPDGYQSIFYNKDIQKISSEFAVPWAVQYELARLLQTRTDIDLTLSKYESILRETRTKKNLHRDLEHLLSGGSRSSLPSQTSTVPVPESGVVDPHELLDEEEEALSNGSERRLGPVSPEDDSWYGGRVLQPATLQKSRSSYKIVLGKLKLQPSTRLSRFYGSRRILRVSIPKDLQGGSHLDSLRAFFGKHFVLNGRVFQALLSKEKIVYLVETMDLTEAPVSPLTSKGRMTLLELIQWHNPMETNKLQSMARWSSRFALIISPSFPICAVDAANARVIDDVIAPYSGTGDPPAYLYMTDGAGCINFALARKIQQFFNLDDVPSAVQARFAGSKGMFYLHPTDATTKPVVWCRRKTQVKISYSNPDPPKQIMEVLRVSHLRLGVSISSEVIICLNHGGVPSATFERLFRAGLGEEYDTLWYRDEPNSALRLWEAVSRLRSVLGTRLRRMDPTRASALSFRNDFVSEDDALETDEDDEDDGGHSWTTDRFSGLPHTTEEIVMTMLQAGFKPNENFILRRKLELIQRSVADRYIKRLRIKIPMSATGYAIPDPLGVLGPGEIFCQSSKPLKSSEVGGVTDLVIGPVVVSRSPCKVQSDVEKFTGIDRPELRDYMDVIIFSVNDYRSPLSRLSGGDYDGDTVVIIWDPDITDSFQNATRFAGDPPDGFVSENFDNETESVAQFQERVQQCTSEETIQGLRSYLLGSLSDPYSVGLYSTFHEIATYQYGYDDPRTERLAHMFFTCLDITKSGLTIKAATRRLDSRTFGGFDLPAWNPKVAERRLFQNPRPPVRAANLGPFIMDELREAGVTILNELHERYPDAPYARRIDLTLSEPYLEAKSRVEHLAQKTLYHGFMEELEGMENLLKRSFEEYEMINRALPSYVGAVRALSKKLHLALMKLEWSLGSRQDLTRTAASFAYNYDFERKEWGSTWPWSMFFNTLCEVKAKSAPESVIATSDFAQRFVLPRSSLVSCVR